MDPIDIGLLFIHRLLGIHTLHVSALNPEIQEFTDQYLFSPLIKKRDYLSIVISDMKERDIYHFTDPLGIRVSLVRAVEEVCILGPYITDALSAAEISKRFAEMQISEKYIDHFQDYVQKLPQLTMDSMYYATHTLLQGIVGYNSNALVKYVNLDKSKNIRLQAEAAGSPITSMPQQLFANVVTADENVGLLYQQETLLAEQMMNGRTESALTTLAHIEKIYRHGTEDAEELEGMKITTVVLCTQMRQTAIQAGVLPTLAEIRARYFLALVRSASSPSGLYQLCRQMLGQFCDLIRKEKLGSLSPKIRQIVQFVMADLSGDLSVENLSAQVNLSPNYLSACFKKEMKQSLSAYIRDRRLESASQFLSYTNMSIHDVAICVGITDFSYFTKIFKEKYGVTPTVYRNKKA